MKKLSLFLRLIVFIYLLSDLTPAISQEMKVIRVADGKIAGNKGNEDGVSENQKYAIYRDTGYASRLPPQNFS